MVIVRGTQRLRDRLAVEPVVEDEELSTWLGPWYATELRWRPGVALFVNESTLLPVLVPMAPVVTLMRRMPSSMAEVLSAHHVPEDWIVAEVAAMATVRIEPTASRSVVGVMNEFVFLADVHRRDYPDDLVGLSVRLSRTPCSPLYKRHVSPNRELAALVAERASS